MVEKKYIHYCWFGGKPLPRLAKKCLKSWKKYLPDYEIKFWNESNSNLEECPFIKGAYENKKWAFVADYVRTKALCEYGGIYFDTDMEVIKNIDHLFTSDTFLGIEDSGYVAVGVWYEKNKNAYLPKRLLETYQKIEKFDINNMWDLSIPHQISKILEEDHLVYGSKQIQDLSHGIRIYPRDYFYPYSYRRDNNMFTDHTCMIHYYDASWVPARERLETFLVRKLGLKKAIKTIRFLQRTKALVRKVARVVLFPLVWIRHYRRKQALVTKEYLERINKTVKLIQKKKKKPYLTFYNSKWLGVTNATKELFDNLIDCGEILRKKDQKRIVNVLIETNARQIIFSSFAEGWKDLAKAIKKKKPSIQIKTFFHGSHSQVLEEYGWARNLEIFDLHQKGIVDVVGTCKESLIPFYEMQGYKSAFISNRVTAKNKPTKKKKDTVTRIGLYAANCNDWRKNVYTQMGAVSLLDNVVLDMVPLSDEAIKFAKLIGLSIQGEKKPLSRDKLMDRMQKNDLNLYVTFSECAPMLPLESMEMGVPCLTGNNHHYFKGDPLEDYLVLNNENNPLEIKAKIAYALENKEHIQKEYQRFSKINQKKSKEQVDAFLKR